MYNVFKYKSRFYEIPTQIMPTFLVGALTCSEGPPPQPSSISPIWGALLMEGCHFRRTSMHRQFEVVMVVAETLKMGEDRARHGSTFLLLGKNWPHWPPRIVNCGLSYIVEQSVDELIDLRDKLTRNNNTLNGQMQEREVVFARLPFVSSSSARSRASG